MSVPSQSRNEHWRPLALILAGIAIALVIVFRLMPYGIRGYNFAPAGAMFLFFGCRLRPGTWYLLPFAVMGGIDLWFYESRSWSFPIWSYVSYVVYLLFGWLMLRHSESPLRIPIVAVAGSLQFFLITNFAVWLSHVTHPEQYGGGSYPLYAPTWAGLLECFEKGLPFYRGTFLSDLIFTPALLAAYAWLARAYFPLERVVPAATSEAHS